MPRHVMTTNHHPHPPTRPSAAAWLLPSLQQSSAQCPNETSQARGEHQISRRQKDEPKAIAKHPTRHRRSAEGACMYLGLRLIKVPAGLLTCPRLILVLRHQLRQEGFSALLCVAARRRGAGLTESWSWPPAFCANAFLMAVVVVVVAAALARATWLAWCVTAWHGGVSRVDCRARGRSRGGWWVSELRLHSSSIEALDLREPCSIVNG
ncbi:hypothetical protein JOL62DRAFT_145092 [Phyllosticta paracitricarpa]|uniref:Uncharacterized protein n=1 Tax=Phyllosticta paracitricarpa TaxID=2016321 RepID=A0ABR1NJ50_9PEZI